MLSVEKTRELESTTTTTNAEGKVKSGDNGDKYSGQSTATQTPNYDNYVTYTIESGNLLYTAKQHLFSHGRNRRMSLWARSSNLLCRKTSFISSTTMGKRVRQKSLSKQ